MASSLPIRKCLQSGLFATAPFRPNAINITRRRAPRYTSSIRSYTTSTPLQLEASLKPAEKAPKQTLLPYHVSRTPSNKFPVYTDISNGRTRKETIIRKISGDARVLRDQIRTLLECEPKDVWVGSVTGHVVVKGHHKPKLVEFLQGKGF